MPLSDLITTSITLDTVRTARAGFGIPLILVTIAEETAAVGFTSPATYVGNDILGDMVTDGWGTTTQPYLMAAAMLAQTPRPRTIVVAARGTPTAAVWEVDITGMTDGDFTITIDGTDFTHTASSETATQIKDALLALIPGASGLDITAGTVDTDTLDLTADNAGENFTISVTNANTEMVLTNTVPNVGADSDLIALQAVDDSWYGILETTRLDFNIKTIAIYAEPREKLFMWQSDSADVQAGTAGNIALCLQASSYLRSPGVWHDNDAEPVDAAEMGRMLPTDPGSETWAWQVLIGQPVSDPAITSADVTQFTAANVNWYESIAGKNTFMNGISPGGNYLDIVRGRDWIISNMNLDLAEALQSAGKIPMTQEGVEIIRGIVEARLLRAAEQGIVTRESIEIETLLIDDAGDGTPFVSDTDKANRSISVTFKATVQGAIHNVAITGTLSI